MSSDLWVEIAKISEKSRRNVFVARSQLRVRLTAEVFTPTELVVKLLRELPQDSFAPGKTVCDPACGDGQFLVAIKYAKMLIWKQKEEEALSDIFGVDILAENVNLCRQRLSGGTIIVGDVLNPDRHIVGQSTNDHCLMKELFGTAQRLLF